MYRGKHHDGFSYAINTIFMKSGYAHIHDPDYLSQRQTALNLCSENGEWFCPVLHWKEYMTILLKNLGIEKGFILEEANMTKISMIPEEIPFVIGEVSIPDWDLTITDKLCGTDSTFLICERIKELFLINNPLGCISMTCSTQYLESLLYNNEAFIFYIIQHPARNVSVYLSLFLLIVTDFQPDYIRERDPLAAYRYRAAHFGVYPRTDAADAAVLSPDGVRVVRGIAARLEIYRRNTKLPPPGSPH